VLRRVYTHDLHSQDVREGPEELRPRVQEVASHPACLSSAEQCILLHASHDMWPVALTCIVAQWASLRLDCLAQDMSMAGTQMHAKISTPIKRGFLELKEDGLHVTGRGRGRDGSPSTSISTAGEYRGRSRGRGRQL